MKVYYSPGTGGFYNTDLFVGPTMLVPDPNSQAEEGEAITLVEVPDPNCNMPKDVVEITAKLHASLVGKNIAVGSDGLPYDAGAPLPSKEEVEANMRVVRNRELLNTDGVVNRHRDEKDMGVPTTITDKAFKDVLVYRQALRDLPDTIAEARTFDVALPAKPPALG